jgi:uncharacterized Zn finger protein
MGRRYGYGRYHGYGGYGGYWPRYVPVAERREKAKRQLERLLKKGHKLDPVVLEGATIARTFWGKAWCHHLETHCDFYNRLGRGRSYVRNGSVCNLVIEPGRVTAHVAGTGLYTVEIEIKKLPPARWKAIRKASTGRIASLVELLRGHLSAAVMEIITHPADGLFPRSHEIEMSCSCPDYAVMCKHVAAALYGVGARLDSRPELLFVLRGVDHTALIDEAVASAALTEAATGPAPAGIEDGELAEIFGVDIAPGAVTAKPAPGKTGGKRNAQRMVKRTAERRKAGTGKRKKPAPKATAIRRKANRR